MWVNHSLRAETICTLENNKNHKWTKDKKLKWRPPAEYVGKPEPAAQYKLNTFN